MQGETLLLWSGWLWWLVSIHSPYAGRDFGKQAFCPGLNSFQSTLPMQGETPAPSTPQPCPVSFNPLSLCRERQMRDHPTPAEHDRFNPLSLCRERLCRRSSYAIVKEFQSTLPMQGETRAQSDTRCCSSFNPLSLCRERRRRRTSRSCWFRCFNPLSLCRERLMILGHFHLLGLFQSTLPMQGETLLACLVPLNASFQSTLPMQGETPPLREARRLADVSIHSPYAGRDRPITPVQAYIPQFQSTLPMQGETLPGTIQGISSLFQSTLPMQGETRGGDQRQRGTVSIHSPYAGRDHHRQIGMSQHALFQSTLPMQGETMRRTRYKARAKSFNPLSLCRERRSLASMSVPSSLFQSTLPMQGETRASWSCPPSGSFNPLSLCRERPFTICRNNKTMGVSIHSPYAGRD